MIRRILSFFRWLASDDSGPVTTIEDRNEYVEPQRPAEWSDLFRRAHEARESVDVAG